MTSEDLSKCPRCGQPITFRKDQETIYPHRDNVTREPCPMGGVNFYEARARVAEARAGRRGDALMPSEQSNSRKCDALAPNIWPPQRCQLSPGHEGAHQAGEDLGIWFLHDAERAECRS